MALDLRIPIGLLFALLGVLLVVYGLVTPAEVYQKSLGINVNAWWGVVMFVFGVAMLVLAKTRAGKGTEADGQ